MIVYYSDEKLKIRSMKIEDAKVIYDTYYSYGWHPLIETYENFVPSIRIWELGVGL